MATPNGEWGSEEGAAFGGLDRDSITLLEDGGDPAPVVVVGAFHEGVNFTGYPICRAGGAILMACPLEVFGQGLSAVPPGLSQRIREVADEEGVALAIRVVPRGREQCLKRPGEPLQPPPGPSTKEVGTP